MSDKKYTRILILGGAGYIGSALHLFLRASRVPDRHGFMPRSVDLMIRGPYCHHTNERRNYRDRAVRKMIEKADDVVLLAGHSSVRACLENPVEAVDNNVMGAAELCGLMRPEQRLIYASSGSVHDYALRTVYDGTKRALDDLVPVLHPNSWGLRFGTVVGKSPNMRWDTMVNAMVRSAMQDGCVRVRNRDNKRPVVDMRDICEAVRRILWGDVPVGAWDLWSQQDSIGRIATRVAARYGVPLAVEDDDGGYSFGMPGLNLVTQPGRSWAEMMDSVEDAVNADRPLRATA